MNNLAERLFDWNASQLVLSGTSETFSGAVYSLFLYVPEGMDITNADANVENLWHEMH